MTSTATRPLLLRGADFIDGSGAPAANDVDVLVVNDQIAEIGPKINEPSASVVDLDGLALAPGFIDAHTHLDAQVLWDADLLPSPWFGVTTVLVGNCGYSLAPTKPAGRESVMRTLENVEGMPFDALREGITWSFETFPQYLDQVSARPLRVNFASMLGHTPLRHYVLGDEATERAATAEEVVTLAGLAREARAHGAFGLSTSRSAVDIGAYGKPVASRLAAFEEMLALARAMAQVGPSAFQVLLGRDFDPAEVAELARACGGSLLWSPALTGIWDDRGGATTLTKELADLAPGAIAGQTHPMPIAQETTLLDPFVLTSVSPAFEEIFRHDRDRRVAAYADPEWLARAEDQLTVRGERQLRQAVIVDSPSNPGLAGRALGELATESGRSVLATVVAIALADALATRFRIVKSNDDETELARLLADDDTVIALGDAGAHASQICDASYPARLLGTWVRDRGALSLERAIWKLSQQPAQLLGIRDRGRIAPGMKADLVAFNPATIADTEPIRVNDQPAGADRLLRHCIGMEHVWVNGVEVRHAGIDLDAHPGTVLRRSA